MTFASLKSDVESAFARTPPEYVYRLAAKELSSRFRLREMEAETTLSVSGETVALPADFLAVRSLFLDTDPRQSLDPIANYSAQGLDGGAGAPRRYVVEGGGLRLFPRPDGAYLLVLRYYAELAPFVADGDTNDVLVRYPALYLYCALKHAAIWAQDPDQATGWATAYEGEAQRVERANRSAMWGAGPLRATATR